ncbi:hypothetical protein [Nocardia rhizosphaerae]|uniref:Uncharacterized protein n=1 Tax=Nocardia rhizosphaerae TaxID=1691571 RepID=A0ABV8L2T8_9NOCA
MNLLRRFARHARHDFAEGRETVEQMLARIDAMDTPPVPPADEYPTAKLPVFTVRQIEERANGMKVLVEVDGGRPIHDLDYATRMDGGPR